MEEDITTVFEAEFNMIGENFLFPKVKTLGTKNKVGDVSPDNLAETYYSQLTKKDVMGLYQMYSLDFELFDYSPELYFVYAK